MTDGDGDGVGDVRQKNDGGGLVDDDANLQGQIRSSQLFLVVAFSSSAVKLLGANARRQQDSLGAKRAGARRDEDGLILWSKGVGVWSSRVEGSGWHRQNQTSEGRRRVSGYGGVPSAKTSSSLDIAVAGRPCYGLENMANADK